jgi:hypothetical protein
MRREGRVVMKREGLLTPVAPPTPPRCPRPLPTPRPRVVMRREGRVVMRREGRVVMRREGRVVMHPAWPMGCKREVASGPRGPTRVPGYVTACAGSTGPHAFGEAAAPRGVDSAQRSVGDQAGYGWSRARSRRRGVGGKPGVKQWSGRPRERTDRE